MLTNKERLQQNNFELAECLELAKDLPSGGSGAAAIPFYDLAALGLPTVATDGTTADLTGIDTSDVRNALDKGAVKFALNVDGSGAVEVVMNKYTIVSNGQYLCTYSVFELTLTLIIAENSIQALVTKSSGLPTVTSADNGKILRVVHGKWTAVAEIEYTGEMEVT